MTTQDKPAVGPLSAGDLNRAHAAWLLALANLPDDVEVNMTTEEAQTALRAALEAVSLAPTAPVEASGSERESEAWEWLGQLYPNDAPSDLAYDANEMIDAFLAGSGRSDRMAKALERIAGEQQYRSGYCQTDITVEPALSADEAQTVAREALAHNPALRPQPSGETLQSLAQAFEDAMEGSHGAWAVSGDYSPLSATTVADKIQADTDAKLTDCPSGETREAVARIRKQLNDLTRPFDNVVACEADDLRTLLAALTVQKEEG